MVGGLAKRWADWPTSPPTAQAAATVSVQKTNTRWTVVSLKPNYYLSYSEVKLCREPHALASKTTSSRLL